MATVQAELGPLAKKNNLCVGVRIELHSTSEIPCRDLLQFQNEHFHGFNPELLHSNLVYLWPNHLLRKRLGYNSNHNQARTQQRLHSH